MSAVRTQYITQTSATIAAGPGVTTVVDIVRPSDPAGVPYAENTDHVVEARQHTQNESGMAVVEVPTTFAIAALLLTAVEVWQSFAPAQSGLSGALFPSGATPSSDGQPTLERVVFSSAAGLAMNSAQLAGILGAVAGSGFTLAAPSFPGIELLDNQFLKLRILNTAGAVGPAIFTAKYDLGVNAVEYRKL